MKTVYGGPFDGGQVDWEDDLVCVKGQTQYHVYLRMQDGHYRYESCHEFPPAWAVGCFIRLKVVGEPEHRVRYFGEYVLA